MKKMISRRVLITSSFTTSLSTKIMSLNFGPTGALLRKFQNSAKFDSLVLTLPRSRTEEFQHGSLHTWQTNRFLILCCFTGLGLFWKIICLWYVLIRYALQIFTCLTNLKEYWAILLTRYPSHSIHWRFTVCVIGNRIGLVDCFRLSCHIQFQGWVYFWCDVENVLFFLKCWYWFLQMNPWASCFNDEFCNLKF